MISYYQRYCHCDIVCLGGIAETDILTLWGLQAAGAGMALTFQLFVHRLEIFQPPTSSRHADFPRRGPIHGSLTSRIQGTNSTWN
jgi:hypothetical protein